MGEMVIQLSYEDTVLQILAKTNLTRAELEAKIDAKVSALSGLVSKEGAAHIVANELDVSLLSAMERPMDVNRLRAGMGNVILEGVVSVAYPLKEFTRQGSNGEPSKGCLRSFVLKDHSGSVRVVLWNDLARKQEVVANTRVKLTECRSKEGYQGGIEVHATGRTVFDVLDAGEPAAVEQMELGSIDHAHKDKVVQVQGAIVEVFPAYFFEVCPQCSKRMRLKEGSYACDVHGAGVPSYSCVLSIQLDDGTDALRTVLFRDQAQQFFKIPMLEFRERKSELMERVQEFLGEEVSVVARVSYNVAYERKELIVQSARVLQPEEFVQSIEN